MRIGHITAVVALAWLLATPAVRAQLSAELVVQPSVVQLGEAADLSIVIRGVSSPRPPNPPQIDGFQVQYVGPQSYMGFINGRVERNTTFHFTLLATKPGTFKIGPFEYDHKGVKVGIEAVQIEVVDPGSGKSTGGTALSDLVYATLECPKRSVFLHEPIDLTLALYVRDMETTGDVNLAGLPESGLDFGRFQELGARRENVNGTIYTVRRFRTKARALSAGTFTLAPRLTIQLVVQSRRQSRGDMFDEFFRNFGGLAETRPYDVAVRPLELTVKPLPEENRPASFSGAVGRFRFEVDARPLRLPAGEPVTITSQIYGDGFLGGVAAPAIAESDVLRVYEPKLIAQTDTERRFEQVVIPRNQLVKEIPSLAFSYFDPETGTYETLKRGPFALEVGPASAQGTGVIQLASPSGGVASATVVVRGEDLVYLKPAPVQWRRADESAAPVWRTAAEWLGPALALGILGLVTRRRDRLATDTVFARRERAPRVARESMDAAARALEANNVPAFFESVWEAIARYFGLKLGLPPGEVSPDKVLGAAARANVAGTKLEALRDVLLQCEAARFGGATASRETMQEMLATVHRTLRACEREL